MSEHKTLDVICLGRAAVDFYGQQIGSRLEDMSSLAKYLGGSSCNIACGTSRLGLKSSMLTRVGDEHMGRFVREELQRNGVDVSHVITDPHHLTGLVILGIKDREVFPLIFYRNDCADMALSCEDFDRAYIASSRALLVTGTHLSTPGTYAASERAMEYARDEQARVVLDIDYRPVLWGLTGPGEGENRFVSCDTVTAHLQSIFPLCDLIVGTEEEIHIAGGSTDTITALRNIRAITDATITLKLGPLGCTVLDGVIPDSDSGFEVFCGVPVGVLNVLGAGDAFMSGFLRGWLRDEPYERCSAYANACGALVVSRHGCTPAIPSEEELFDYLARAVDIERPDLDTRLNYLHRVTNRALKEHSELYVLAFDHRKQFYDMAIAAGASPERIDALKMLLLEAASRSAGQAGLGDNVGVLIDDTYGQEALNAVTGRGWWIGRPVEVPSSRPLELEGGRDISARLATWPHEHIVKCLVFYHPDDPVDLRLQQERQIQELYTACVNSGHEFLLEVIPPLEFEPCDNAVVNTMARMYNLGIYPDWWKLPSPSRATWQGISDLIAQRAPHCRGVVLLGLDAPMDELRQGFNNSVGFDVCKGFAVGRSIFGGPSQRWLANDIDDEEFITQVSDNYLQLIDIWRARRAD